VLGGLKSVTQTDVVQFFLIAICFAIPSLLAVLGVTYSSETRPFLAVDFEAIPFELAAYLTFPILFVPFSQDLAVRTKAAQSSKQAKIGIIVGVSIYAFVVAASVHIGVYARQHGITLVDTETVVGQFFLYAFPAMHAFVAVAIAAAIASTLDSWTYSAILIVASDILPHSHTKDSPPKHRVIIGAIIVLTLALTVALAVQQILALILLALYIYVAVLIPSALGRKLGLRDLPLAVLASATAICMATMHFADIAVPYQPYTFPFAHAVAVALTAFIPSCRRSHHPDEEKP
jgi:Na+/proline symporter